MAEETEIGKFVELQTSQFRARGFVSFDAQYTGKSIAWEARDSILDEWAKARVILHQLADKFIDYTLNNPDTLTKYKQAAQISQKVLQAVSGTF
jgi:hypothetical protein